MFFPLKWNIYCWCQILAIVHMWNGFISISDYDKIIFHAMRFFFFFYFFCCGETTWTPVHRMSCDACNFPFRFRWWQMTWRFIIHTWWNTNSKRKRKRKSAYIFLVTHEHEKYATLARNEQITFITCPLSLNPLNSYSKYEKSFFDHFPLANRHSIVSNKPSRFSLTILFAVSFISRIPQTLSVCSEITQTKYSNANSYSILIVFSRKTLLDLNRTLPHFYTCRLQLTIFRANGGYLCCLILIVLSISHWGETIFFNIL